MQYVADEQFWLPGDPLAGVSTGSLAAGLWSISKGPNFLHRNGYVSQHGRRGRQRDVESGRLIHPIMVGFIR